MGKSIGKNISKNFNIKYNYTLLDHAKQSATDALESFSKRVIHKTAEATGYLNGNKIADKITRVSKNSPQNNLEANEEILREKSIFPELKQRIIDNLRLKKD